jgi:hypothetical protein
VDTEVLPGLLCAIAGKMRENLKVALLGVAGNVAPGGVACAEDAKGSDEGAAAEEGAGAREGAGTDELARPPTIELKVRPVKRANRIAVKVGKYREEKGEENWPHSQYLTVSGNGATGMIFNRNEPVMGFRRESKRGSYVAFFPVD